jgi:hypothetical protein
VEWQLAEMVEQDQARHRTAILRLAFVAFLMMRLFAAVISSGVPVSTLIAYPSGRLAADRRARPLPDDRPIIRLCLHAIGHLAAVFRQLLHDGLMESDILLGGPVGASVDIQFLRKLLARVQAGVEIKKFEQIDDRRWPITSAVFLAGHLREDRFYIDRGLSLARG